MRSEVSGSVVLIDSSSGFSPSPLPALLGEIQSDGTVNVRGAGTIAGVDNVSVTGSGVLMDGRLQMVITVGADGRLPGGQPIRYTFVQ